MPERERASPTDDERERLAAALRRHVADGRLDLAQFDERVAGLYRASTRAEAHAALDGLPPLDPVAPEAARRRAAARHGEPGRIEDHWIATGEVFRDPSTGRVMRVWMDPADGTRHYGPAD